MTIVKFELTFSIIAGVTFTNVKYYVIVSKVKWIHQYQITMIWIKNRSHTAGTTR